MLSFHTVVPDALIEERPLDTNDLDGQTARSVIRTDDESSSASFDCSLPLSRRQTALKNTQAGNRAKACGFLRTRHEPAEKSRRPACGATPRFVAWTRLSCGSEQGKRHEYGWQVRHVALDRCNDVRGAFCGRRDLHQRGRAPRAAVVRTTGSARVRTELPAGHRDAGSTRSHRLHHGSWSAWSLAIPGWHSGRSFSSPCPVHARGDSANQQAVTGSRSRSIRRASC